MPVEARQLDVQAVLLLDAASQRVHEQRHQDQDPDRDVRAVEARQHEERGAEQVRAQAQAFVVELRELVRLAGDEERAEDRRGEQPDLHASATLPFWIAASASTMLTLLISRTKALTDVNGMSKRSSGYGPTTLRSR